MSNSYNTNPIVLDTTMAATAKNSGCNYGGQFKIRMIHWDNAKTLSTDKAILLDDQGNTFYAETAASSVPWVLPYPWVVNDFKLTQLDEGKIYIYLQ